ncbi:MAG: LysM peptidoglycan-binding domain-containing protein [Endomicrobiales bacterium]|nr:LysM peptidoglycan-binding domain-containing protein [Endomicrobiales bacterium]
MKIPKLDDTVPEKTEQKKEEAVEPEVEEEVQDIPDTEEEQQEEKTITETQREGRIHKVWLWQETRDCLWNLAEKYYGDPWLWKEIYLANQDQIKDPRIIYPKQKIVIPKLNTSN